MTNEIKAVIFDIDGTAMVNRQDALPSERTVRAVRAAQEFGIRMCCATGRNFEIAKHITTSLGLTDPSIFGGGTQIIQPASGEELWAGFMPSKTVESALRILSPYDLRVLVDGDTYETALTANKIDPKSYRMLDVQHVNINDLPIILEELAKLESVTAIPVDSNDPESFFLHITDLQATKEHAAQELLQLLNLDSSQVAGVGDGLNDLELYKVVGHKVAVGNAREELKHVADEVIGSVEQDGFAIYLEGLVQ